MRIMYIMYTTGHITRAYTQIKLYEFTEGSNNFALSVPAHLALKVISRGGLSPDEVNFLVSKIQFKHINKQGLVFQMIDIYFDQELERWVIIFSPEVIL